MKKLLSLIATSAAGIVFLKGANQSLAKTIITNVQNAEKQDISKVTIADPQTYASPNGKYEQLNSNQAIINLIIQAISTQSQAQSTINDFTITNDQSAQAMQKSGQIVKFTVRAKETSESITGSFIFSDTLMVPDISGIKINDLKTIVNPASTYGDLNNDPAIINAIRTAISSKLAMQIPISYLKITNDQTVGDIQTAGKVITFTVAANGSEQQIIGSFTFTDTLSKTDISGIKIDDPASPIVNDATYGDLNQDANIITTVRRSIQAQTGVNVAPTDLAIMNDQEQTAKQAVGTKVTFTVTATDTAGLITGSLNFVDTLSASKINITALEIPEYVTFVDPNKTYGDLNNDARINNMIVQLINHTYNVECTSSDFTLTNNQDYNVKQTKQTIVTFIVTAKDDSSLIAGKTTFVDTLLPRSINQIIVSDLKTVAQPKKTYDALNSNPEIVNQILDQINSQLNYKVSLSDIAISNDQGPNLLQKTGQKVTFTVNALNISPVIEGSFQFFDTLQ